MIEHENWEHLFDKAGAIWRYQENGVHAAYEMADKHADFYFNTDVALSHPELNKKIATTFASLAAEHNISPTWVISYTAGVSCGLALAALVANSLHARFGYVDLNKSLCYFTPESAATILIVTDDLHSGGSLQKTIKLLNATKGVVLPVVMTLANFSGQTTSSGLEIVSLCNESFNSWPKDSCALCKKGSVAIAARQNWEKLCHKQECMY